MARESEGSNIPAKTRDLGGLVIDIIRSSDAEENRAKAMKQVSGLYLASNRAHGVISVPNFNKAQYCFLGRLPGNGRSVGVVYLNRDASWDPYLEAPCDRYQISMITLLGFEKRGIATALTGHAVDFAYSAKEIGAIPVFII